MLVLVEVLALIVASEYSLSISIVLFSLDEFGFLPKKLRQKLDTKRHKDSNGKRTKGVSCQAYDICFPRGRALQKGESRATKIERFTMSLTR